MTITCFKPWTQGYSSVTTFFQPIVFNALVSGIVPAIFITLETASIAINATGGHPLRVKSSPHDVSET